MVEINALRTEVKELQLCCISLSKYYLSVSYCHWFTLWCRARGTGIPSKAVMLAKKVAGRIDCVITSTYN